MLATKNQRLNFFVKSLHLKTSEFANEVGTSQPSMSLILTGKRALSRGMIARIKQKYPRLNISWLLTGEGSMVIDPSIGISQYVGRDGNNYNNSIVEDKIDNDKDEIVLVELNEQSPPKELMTEIFRLKALLFDRDEEIKKIKTELSALRKTIKTNK